jgi:small subunit ribosomal protein S9
MAKTDNKKEKYFEAVGRRKSAIARVRLFDSKNTEYIINNKKLEDYLKVLELQKIIGKPLTEVSKHFRVSVKVIGGGIRAQAEAIRLGISRALVIFNPEFRGQLKKLGYLKRDSRVVERKKPGLKKARKAPQWSKR